MTGRRGLIPVHCVQSADSTLPVSALNVPTGQGTSYVVFCKSITVNLTCRDLDTRSNEKLMKNVAPFSFVTV